MAHYSSVLRVPPISWLVVQVCPTFHPSYLLRLKVPNSTRYHSKQWCHCEINLSTLPILHQAYLFLEIRALNYPSNLAASTLKCRHGPVLTPKSLADDSNTYPPSLATVGDTVWAPSVRRAHQRRPSTLNAQSSPPSSAAGSPTRPLCCRSEHRSRTWSAWIVLPELWSPHKIQANRHLATCFTSIAQRVYYWFTSPWSYFSS